MPENELTPLDHEYSDVILRILDPAILEEYRRLKREYRRICTAHERNFAGYRRRVFHRNGQSHEQRLKEVEEAKRAMLSYEAYVFQKKVKQLVEKAVGEGKIR